MECIVTEVKLLSSLRMSTPKCSVAKGLLYNRLLPDHSLQDPLPHSPVVVASKSTARTLQYHPSCIVRRYQVYFGYGIILTKLKIR